MREIRTSGSGEGAVPSRPYLIQEPWAAEIHRKPHSLRM